MLQHSSSSSAFTAEALPSAVGVLNESQVRDYVTLLKPRVMTLVVFCGLAGMVAAPGHLHPFLQLVTLLCIALGSGGSGAINMWYDRDIDADMMRTAARPIPSGRVRPDDALAYGIAMAAFSVLILGLAVGWLAASILLAAILTYVFVYTMGLKRRTPQNIVIGGAAGAFPPMIGWAAVTGNLTLEPLLLFGIIFLWTPPHFWALALYRNADYRRVGVPMLPVVRGDRHTRGQIVLYTLILVAFSFLPWMLAMKGDIYAAASILLGAGFIYHAFRVWKDEGDGWAKRTFAFSMLYLFLLFSAVIADSLAYGGAYGG